MPKIRDILIHVSVEEAQRQRRRKTNHMIAKGERCLVVKTNPTNDDYSYSLAPAKEMLDVAWAKLKGIYGALGLTPPA